MLRIDKFYRVVVLSFVSIWNYAMLYVPMSCGVSYGLIPKKNLTVAQLPPKDLKAYQQLCYMLSERKIQFKKFSRHVETMHNPDQLKELIQTSLEAQTTYFGA